MRTLYCSICSCNFDPEKEGIEGDIGIIPVAFCATCKAGIRDFAEQHWDLAPTGQHEILKVEECGCPEGADENCINILCPRK